MARLEKVTIDGETLYITDLMHTGKSYINNSKNNNGKNDPDFTSDHVQSALKPIVKTCKKITEGMYELAPDEAELTIQLSAGVDNNKLFFALASLNAEAQISVKYIWKKNPDNMAK